MELFDLAHRRFLVMLCPLLLVGFTKGTLAEPLGKSENVKDSFLASQQKNNLLDGQVSLFSGESLVLSAPNVRRVVIGNGKIATVKLLKGSELLLLGGAPGITSLMIWDTLGKVTTHKIVVTISDVTKSNRDLLEFVRQIPNLKASPLGEKIILDGDNISDRDLSKLAELTKLYPQIVNLTNKLGWEKMVMLDVKIVEFPTNLLRDLGMKWNAVGGAAVAGVISPWREGVAPGLTIQLPGGADGLPVSQGNSQTTPLPARLNLLSALNLGLSGAINLLVREGKGSILAQPQLSARNGSKASFLAGGEYPYTVSTVSGQTVLFKPFGIKLEIVPQVDGNNMVRAVIETEVSSLDTSIATNAGPALSTRRTSTEFNVAAGETMVLSGLLSRKTTTSVDKVPLLGDAPLIGALFRSKRFQNDETELVIFVTPVIVDAHSSSLKSQVDSATERLKSDAGKYPYLPIPSDLNTKPRNAELQPF